MLSRRRPGSQPIAPAPPERVFAAFGDAGDGEPVADPVAGVRLRVLQLDFRPGGAYRFAYDVPGRRNDVRQRRVSRRRAASTIVFSWHIEPPDEHAGIRSEVTVTLDGGWDGNRAPVSATSASRCPAPSSGMPMAGAAPSLDLTAMLEGKASPAQDDHVRTGDRR